MSDYLDRVEAFLDAREASGEARRGLITVAHGGGSRDGERPGMYRRPLTDADLRALLADAKQLRAQGTEYGIRADFTDTTSAEFTVAETLDEALEALARFDEEYGGKVVSRELTVRPVGGWRKVGDDARVPADETREAPEGAVRARMAATASPKPRPATAQQLHARFAHPGFEYATTQGPRKAWDQIDEPPEGDGWERNGFAGRDGWERFDYHEESYWYRRRPEESQQIDESGSEQR